MIEWAGNELKGLGASVEYADVGMQTLHDGTQIKLPPVLMAQVSTVKEIFPLFPVIWYLVSKKPNCIQDFAVSAATYRQLQFILQLGNDPKKKTVLLYGHLDVQPALMSDG